MPYIKRINESAERGTTGRFSGQFLGGWAGFVYSSIRLFVYSSIRLWEVLWNIAYWDVRG